MKGAVRAGNERKREGLVVMERTGRYATSGKCVSLSSNRLTGRAAGKATHRRGHQQVLLPKRHTRGCFHDKDRRFIEAVRNIPSRCLSQPTPRKAAGEQQGDTATHSLTHYTHRQKTRGHDGMKEEGWIDSHRQVVLLFLNNKYPTIRETGARSGSRCLGRHSLQVQYKDRKPHELLRLE